MVLFFIADLALTIAFKVSSWCLGKTCDGIMYLVTRRKSNKDDDDDEFVVVSRQEYCVLKKFHGLHHASASEDAPEDASEDALMLMSPSTSK
jgi:hypothetical protein